MLLQSQSLTARAARGRPVAEPEPTFGTFGTRAASMSAGQWLEVTSDTNIQAITDTAGFDGTTAWTDCDISNAVPMLDWPGKATWDVTRKQFITSGNGAGQSGNNGIRSKVLRMDVTTGTIVSQWNPVGSTIGHLYDSNPSRPIGNFIWRRAYQNEVLYRINLADNSWTSLGSLAPSVPGGESPALDVFPEYGTGGAVVFCCFGGRVVVYNIATTAVTVVATSLTGVASTVTPICSYHPGIGKMVLGGGTSAAGDGRLYTMDTANTLTQLSSSLPAGVTAISPDGGVGNTVYLPDPQGRAYAWLYDQESTRKVWRQDLSTGSWTEIGAFPSTFALPKWATGANCPELGVHIWMDGDVRSGGTSNSRVWLYKPA